MMKKPLGKKCWLREFLALQFYFFQQFGML